MNKIVVYEFTVFESINRKGKEKVCGSVFQANLFLIEGIGSNPIGRNLFPYIFLVSNFYIMSRRVRKSKRKE